MKIITRRAALVFIVLFFALSASCRSPAPVQTPPPEKKPELEIKVEEKAPDVKPEVVEEKNEVVIETTKIESPPIVPDAVPFDPSSITKEVFDSTKTDVQSLIERLNTIIRDKDYEMWVTFLGKDYRAALNDPSFLERISSSSILRTQKISLKSLRDYFIYVVVPSRAHDRADDIEFIGQNRVKAFTVDSKGRRLRLYDLEKTPTGWEIIN